MFLEAFGILSCGMRDIFFLAVACELLVEACELLVAAYGI